MTEFRGQGGVERSPHLCHHLCRGQEGALDRSAYGSGSPHVHFSIDNSGYAAHFVRPPCPVPWVTSGQSRRLAEVNWAKWRWLSVQANYYVQQNIADSHWLGMQLGNFRLSCRLRG